MNEKSDEHFSYVLETEILPDLDYEKLATAVSEAEEEVYKLLEKKLKIKLLEPPLEAEIIRENTLIKIKLTIRVAVSPFSHYFSKKQELADIIAKEFYNMFVSKISKR